MKHHRLSTQNLYHLQRFSFPFFLTKTNESSHSLSWGNKENMGTFATSPHAVRIQGFKEAIFDPIMVVLFLIQ